jgi:hypothetical protein
MAAHAQYFTLVSCKLKKNYYCLFIFSYHIFQLQIKTRLPWSLPIFPLKTKIQLSYQLVVPHLLDPHFSFVNCLSCVTLRRSLRRSRGRGCTSRATESAIRCRTATWRAALLRHLLENKKTKYY